MDKLSEESRKLLAELLEVPEDQLGREMAKIAKKLLDEKQEEVKNDGARDDDAEDGDRQG